MATTFAVKCAPHVGFIPTDDEGAAYLHKNAGKLVQIKVSQPRSLQQNSKLWAVAEMVHENLPPKWEGQWPDKYRMVKGLQLALGITDDVMVPGKDIVRTPSSIAEMDHDEANAACDLLFRGMARLLDVTVDELLNEAQRRAA